MEEPRRLFSDGINSAIHIGLGYIANINLAILFTMYQLSTANVNTGIDMMEFLFGVLLREGLSDT